MLRTLLRTTSTMMKALPRGLTTSSNILSRFNLSAASSRWNSNVLCENTKEKEGGGLGLDLSSWPLPKSTKKKRGRKTDIDNIMFIAVKPRQFRKEIRKEEEELDLNDKKKECMYDPYEILENLGRACLLRAAMFILDTLDPVVLRRIYNFGKLCEAIQTPDQIERRALCFGDDYLYFFFQLKFLEGSSDKLDYFFKERREGTRLPTRFDMLKANLDYSHDQQDYRKVIDRTLLLNDFLKKNLNHPGFDDPLHVWSFLHPEQKSF